MTHDRELAFMRRVLTAYDTHDLLGLDMLMAELRTAISSLDTQKNEAQSQPARQPLTDAEIKSLLTKTTGWSDFARAIERAHKIEAD